MPMLNDTSRERFAQSIDEPYSPANAAGVGLETDVTLRIAHALEYIAAQFGQINLKIDKLARQIDGGRD